jgi:hypothetical protein
MSSYQQQNYFEKYNKKMHVNDVALEYFQTERWQKFRFGSYLNCVLGVYLIIKSLLPHCILSNF